MLVEPETDAKVKEVIDREKAVTAAATTASDRKRRSRHEGKQTARSRLTYTARLTGAFALTALMTAFIAATVLSIVWEDQFAEYTRENMENIASRTADYVATLYADEGGYTSNLVRSLDNYTSFSDEIATQILNAENTVIYDNSLPVDVSSDEMDSLAPAKEKMASASIVVDGEKIGTVRIWAYESNALLTRNDIQFRSNSYKAVILAAIIAVALAGIIGLLFAKGLVNPIKRITATAQKIKGGDYTARTNMVATDEIGELGETFDDMAESIQHDRELEHRLTADVAHELRTPLMGIQATTEAIMDGVFEPDAERLNAINSETMRLKRLVDALLNLSRLESGSVPFNEERIDLVELMAGLVMSHEALLEAAELTLEYETDDSVIVDGDPDMLRQATANLISNAVRYNKPGGKVTLGVHARGDLAAISVADTGIGIAEEDKERVFSRFWRADAARNRASGGLGVGLAVVKQIVDYHNGTIEVDSEVGVGTTFTILIPLHHDAVPKPTKALKPARPVRDAKGTKSAKDARSATSAEGASPAKSPHDAKSPNDAKSAGGVKPKTKG